MSAKLKKSSKPLNRPFSNEILRRARAIAQGYQIIIEFEDGEYYGRGVELPNVMADGKTPDECVSATRDALATGVAFLLENGEQPPPPVSENLRTEQINVRLTAEEKVRLETAARSKGFRGISDFVRNASLASLNK
jgi:predicted RNase H-like HicB family nuclease